MTPADMVVSEVRAEINRALEKHPGTNSSAHHGYAVILEELDELWDEVKAKSLDKDKARKEAIQVAAMAVRFILECCQ